MCGFVDEELQARHPVPEQKRAQRDTSAEPERTLLRQPHGYRPCQ